MVNVYCDNEECERRNFIMDIVEEEFDGQRWHKATYQCPSCGCKKEHCQCWDQNGLVISDEISDLEENKKC